MGIVEIFSLAKSKTKLIYDFNEYISWLMSDTLIIWSNNAIKKVVLS